MYTRRILISLELKLKLPIILDIDNKSTVDFINNWSVGLRNSHVETCQFFLCEMKEQEIFQMSRIIGDENEVGFFTKIFQVPCLRSTVVISTVTSEVLEYERVLDLEIWPNILSTGMAVDWNFNRRKFQSCIVVSMIEM